MTGMVAPPPVIRCPRCGQGLAALVGGAVVSVVRVRSGRGGPPQRRVYVNPERIDCERPGCGGAWRRSVAGGAAG
jgi:hypothetical protein